MERINKPIAVQCSVRRPVMTQDRKPQALPKLDKMSSYQRTNLKYTKCGKIGHTQKRCYFSQQNFPNRQFRKIPPSQMRVHRVQKTTKN